MIINTRQSFLHRVSKLVGTNNKLGKAIDGYIKIQEANQISSHFSSYLEPVIATSDDLKEQVFNIRHEVYCEELNFESQRSDKRETDEFDAFSKYCLIKHTSSLRYAGTVRLVSPFEQGQLLPLEKFCMDSITHRKLNPKDFARNEICEISRLAVPYQFRRRQMDKFSGAATGAINTDTYSETELRCFPFIAVGLYFSAAALAFHEGIQHAFVMMEPRLARSMRFIGIKFEQIGPVIDYHGRRAPYYISQELLLKNLTPGFQIMLKHIQNTVDTQLNQEKSK